MSDSEHEPSGYDRRREEESGGGGVNNGLGREEGKKGDGRGRWSARSKETSTRGMPGMRKRTTGGGGRKEGGHRWQRGLP